MEILDPIMVVRQGPPIFCIPSRFTVNCKERERGHGADVALSIDVNCDFNIVQSGDLLSANHLKTSS